MTVDNNDAKKAIKIKELDKLLSVLFLRNANHDRFGELLVEYRQAFTNKDVKSQQNLGTMMDFMCQQSLKKKVSPTKTPENGK